MSNEHGRTGGTGGHAAENSCVLAKVLFGCSASFHPSFIQAQLFLSFAFQNCVLLGSDYPFPLGEHHPGKLVESMDDLSPETKVINEATGSEKEKTF